MELSNYQSAIIEHVSTSSNNLCVNAVAGSGKTTTAILAILAYLKACPNAKVVCSAFNKSIADELSARINDARCMCKTSHSLGLKAIRNYLRLNGQNLPLIINDKRDHFKLLYNLSDYSKCIDDETPNDVKFDFISRVDKLLELCRLNLIQCDDAEGINAIADEHGIICLYDEVACVRKFLSTAYELSLEKNVKEVKGRTSKVHPQAWVIDFCDMLTFGATHGQYCLKFDLFVADECQDFNKAQHGLLFNSLKRHGKFLCVGDPKQAINGFCGAMNDSYDKLAEKADVLPLSVNYRCGSNIINMAQEIVPQIMAHDGAIEGEIKDVESLKECKDGDFIICRTKAPLVKVALKFLRNGRTAQILGADLGKNLKSYIRSAIGSSKASLSYSTTLLMDKLQEVYDKTFEEIRNKGYKGNIEEHPTLLAMQDKMACVDNISLEVATVGEVYAKIDYLFSDERKAHAVTLMTAHKSKGLENDNVFILLPHKLPLTWKEQKDWQYQQEVNLKYVAITRAKKSLYFVRLDEEGLNEVEVE